MMKGHGARLLAVVVAALGLSCARGRAEPVLPPPPPVTASPVELWPNRMEKPKTAAEARARRIALDSRPPDSRFLRAMESLALLGGSAPTPVEARHHALHWYLVQRAATVAVLPEWPGFAPLFDAVVGHAAARPPASESPSPSRSFLVGAALGEREEALELESELIQSYPSGGAASAGIYWRAGRWPTWRALVRRRRPVRIGSRSGSCWG